VDAEVKNDKRINHIHGKKMPTLLVYTSRHGCAEKCAQKLKDHMDSDVQIISIEESSKFKLSEFDSVIIGDQEICK
jgi:menaquinone-dependent protoporphyrinogen IX oxidase